MMKFKGLVATLALALAAPAMAVPVHLGDLGPPGSASFGNVFFAPDESFHDEYTFTLGSWATGGGTIGELDLSAVLGLDIHEVRINGNLLDVGNIFGVGLFNLGYLGNGLHTLSILGSVNSESCRIFCLNLGVKYAGNLVLLPTQPPRAVPEPATLGLLGLGLLGVALARRRKAV